MIPESPPTIMLSEEDDPAFEMITGDFSLTKKQVLQIPNSGKLGEVNSSLYRYIFCIEQLGVKTFHLRDDLA